MPDFIVNLSDGHLQVDIGLPVFDARAVPEFKRALAPWRGLTANSVVVDIRRVQTIDCSALSALLWLCQSTGRRHISLQGACAQVRSVVELTRLQQVFSVEQRAVT